MVMTGDVTAREDVTIAGHVDGTIELSDYVVTITTTVTVTASIVARIVTIRGHVTESVAASVRVGIQDTRFLGGQRHRSQHHARRGCGFLWDRDDTRVGCVIAHRRALRTLTRATPIRRPRARGSACRRARQP